MTAPPRPNLFLIGAMKSGTSSLYTHLAAHPAVFLSRPKEPCYFVDPEVLHRYWPEMWERGYWRSEAAYLSLFAQAGEATVIGEASTDYAKLPRYQGVPERIAAFAPEARFLYIMRDPVDRTLSHYWHEVEYGRERRPLLEAIRTDPHYREVSHYAMQIAPYLERFGPDRVLALTFEGYKADPAATMRQVYGWLGVDPALVPEEMGEKQNVTPPVVRQTRGLGMLQRFRHSAAWSAVEGLVPKRVREWGRGLADRPVERDAARQEADQARAYLRPLQHAETEDLSRLLGRDFPEWRTLYGE
jgi:hypothetical protein